jgi:hypothetical protein
MKRFHPHRQTFVAILPIVLILLVGCGAQGSTSRSKVLESSVPPWMFVWNPPVGGIPASVPMQKAFMEGARGVDAATGNAHPIYFVAWLMIGPTYGDAIVQFAKGDSYLNEAGLAVNPKTHDWDGGGGDILTPGAKCTQGVVHNYVGDTCGAFIGTCQCADGPTADWLDAQGNVFMARRVPYTATRPAGATTVTFGSLTGWETTPGLGFSSVVVPLTDGSTFFLGSTASPAQTKVIAGDALAHLDALTPLP